MDDEAGREWLRGDPCILVTPDGECSSAVFWDDLSDLPPVGLRHVDILVWGTRLCLDDRAFGDNWQIRRPKEGEWISPDEAIGLIEKEMK